LAAGGATRDGAFLLSEVELIRFGSDVASGHQLSQSCGIKSQGRNWACSIIRDCPSWRSRHCVMQEVAKIMISEEGHA
jgi:hypothetical protein